MVHVAMHALAVVTGRQLDYNQLHKPESVHDGRRLLKAPRSKAPTKRIITISAALSLVAGFLEDLRQLQVALLNRAGQCLVVELSQVGQCLAVEQSLEALFQEVQSLEALPQEPRRFAPAADHTAEHCSRGNRGIVRMPRSRHRNLDTRSQRTVHTLAVPALALVLQLHPGDTDPCPLF
mmetsp:Transcript_20009/g.38588  ORF Transcript_20009/g.38588 Transcript_20009/m.38588 type:complete len:179 (+) Transcript_20009:79-615(+)